MSHLLSTASGELVRWARGRALFGFDYDGTLAPIADAPARAEMRPRTREALTRLAAKRPVVVVSGRRLSELAGFLHDVGCAALVGNHGLEWREHTPAGLPTWDVAHWVEQLARMLREQPGVTIEDKGLSLSVHFRNAPDPQRAHAVVTTAARHLQGTRLVEGHMVLNVLPAAAPHKGVALEHLRRRLACTHAIFLGDDVTDEDVFRMPGKRLLGVRVGADPGSHARHHLAGQDEVDAFLDRLLELTEVAGS